MLIRCFVNPKRVPPPTDMPPKWVNWLLLWYTQAVPVPALTATKGLLPMLYNAIAPYPIASTSLTLVIGILL